MKSIKSVTVDPWSWLDFKEGMVSNRRNHPPWVGRHWRRLQAYTLYDMYYRNRGEHWIDIFKAGDVDDWREYGDPYIVTEQILASVLGQDQSLVVPSADDTQAPSSATALQTQINNWAKLERFNLKMLECERNTVKLGDGVYVLGWSTTKQRPVLRVYDPGFFFPVWGDDDIEEEFPRKVHLAYEYKSEDPNKQDITYIRRITYELVSTDETQSSDSVPWREENSQVTCIMSDGVWELHQEVQHLDDLNMNRANWRVRDLDLKLDFIPVVHLPNNNSGNEFYGVSSLAPVMQILDDIIGQDTDLAGAATITNTPILAVQGGAGTLPTDDDGKVLGYKPGTVYETDGPLTHLDMSRGLDASMKYLDNLLERLSINGRIPESLMGRIKPSDVPSGIALWLSFSPHSSMVEEMRDIRRNKYSLLLKFVGRMYQLNNMLDGDLEDIEMRFGSYLPADKKETMDMLVNASNSKSSFMSLALRVRMLEEAGFPIEDAQEEIKRIIAEDVDTAEKIVSTTGDLAAGRSRLGLPPTNTGFTEQEIEL